MAIAQRVEQRPVLYAVVVIAVIAAMSHTLRPIRPHPTHLRPTIHRGVAEPDPATEQGLAGHDQVRP